MYCRNCGKEIDDKAYICIHCGVKVQEETPRYIYPKTYKAPFNGFALAGLIWAVFIPLLGWIFGGIGLHRANRAKFDEAGKVMSILAITLASVSFVIALALQVAFM